MTHGLCAIAKKTEVDEGANAARADGKIKSSGPIFVFAFGEMGGIVRRANTGAAPEKKSIVSIRLASWGISNGEGEWGSSFGNNNLQLQIIRTSRMIWRPKSQMAPANTLLTHTYTHPIG